MDNFKIPGYNQKHMVSLGDMDKTMASSVMLGKISSPLRRADTELTLAFVLPLVL